MKFLHSMIRVKDLKKSLDFYMNLMGLRLDRKSDLEDCTLYFLKDDTTGTEIELTDNWEKPKNGYKNGDAFGHFAFEVNSLDEFSKKLSALKYEYLYEPYEIVLKNENGTETKKIAFIKDPDDNELEIIEK